jgi:hypothetical protein
MHREKKSRRYRRLFDFMLLRARAALSKEGETSRARLPLLSNLLLDRETGSGYR